jgi:hypothetical protein
VNYKEETGLRLTFSGKVTKELIQEKLSILLDSLFDENNIEQSDGVNINLNIHTAEGDNLIPCLCDGSLAQAIVLNDIEDNFSFSKLGMTLATKKQIEEKNIFAKGLRDKAYTSFWKKRKSANSVELRNQKALAAFRDFISSEFNADAHDDSFLSLGRIESRHTVLKYLEEDEIPLSGVIYRATFKKEVGKTVHIYDDDHVLISKKEIDLRT